MWSILLEVFLRAASFERIHRKSTVSATLLDPLLVSSDCSDEDNKTPTFVNPPRWQTGH
jgi:hypothetical protein